MKEEIILRYWNKRSPLHVLVKQDGKLKMIWNFLYEYHDKTFWAEGYGGELAPGFRKNCFLGRDREKALETYNRIFVQEKRAHKKEYLKEYYE